MILRSFPITDFSPLEGALTGDWVPLGRVRGSSGLGSVEELRVYMKSPKLGSAWHSTGRASRGHMSSTSPRRCLPGDGGLKSYRRVVMDERCGPKGVALDRQVGQRPLVEAMVATGLDDF
jgi:hypothetical protein